MARSASRKAELDQAEALLRRALALSPESPQASGNLAAVLQACGRHAEAVAQFEHALARQPDMLDARFGLAAALQSCGRPEDAVACYAAITARQADHAEAYYGWASALLRLGRTEEAAAKYRAALAADPDFAEASYGLGRLLARGNRLEEAVRCFLQALDVDADYIEARVALGNALSRLQRDEEALAAFQQVLAAEPGHTAAHTGIAAVLDRKRRHAEAIDHYRVALNADPDNVDALGGMSGAMKNIGRHDEALAMARKLLALRPDFPRAAALLGSVLAEIGAMDEALTHLRRAVALAPEQPEFAYHLVQLAKVRRGDPALDTLEAVLRRADALPVRDRSLLHFALAKACDDLGERDRGFTHLLTGNALKRAETAYDEAATLRAMEHIARVFTAELIAQRRELGDPSHLPVFIVGMPRSGTTLVEQTLASHAAVFGAGERSELSQLIGSLSAERLGAGRFPEAVWTMTGERFRQMGAAYLAALRPLAPGAARITDKMPLNFLHVGMIHLILPQARIVHCVRDPVDTCLSCFSKLFAGEQPFAYDLAELGRFYHAYRRLMAHWRTVLPPGVMLEVAYEAMVEDFPEQAHRLVAHCGLDWDPACLEFYKTSRPVHTASMTQVRQPIYRSSVGRWRPDGTLLQPLLTALGEA